MRIYSIRLWPYDPQHKLQYEERAHPMRCALFLLAAQGYELSGRVFAARFNFFMVSTNGLNLLRDDTLLPA